MKSLPPLLPAPKHAQRRAGSFAIRERVPIVLVKEGFVGVQTLFSGAEPADRNM